jgi:hypothetical protein
MAQDVIIRPTPCATTAWYVRRLCSRVSDHMARGAMTPAEPHVQQASSDPTQGDEPSTLPVTEVLPPCLHQGMCLVHHVKRLTDGVASYASLSPHV